MDLFIEKKNTTETNEQGNLGFKRKATICSLTLK